MSTEFYGFVSENPKTPGICEFFNLECGLQKQLAAPALCELSHLHEYAEHIAHASGHAVRLVRFVEAETIKEFKP